MSIIQPKPYLYRVWKLDLSGGDIADQRVPFAGEKLIYHWGTQTLDIKLNSPGNDAIKCRPKQEIIAPFSDFFVSAEQREETVELIIMNPASINLGGGEVRVITDTGHYDTIAQRGFVATTSLGGSDTPGIIPVVQLWNPATSPVHALVDTVKVQTYDFGGSPGNVDLYYNNTALGDDNGTVENKYLYGRTSNLQMREAQIGPG